MFHHGASVGVIQRVIAEAVVRVGLPRIRTLPISDEELALNIINALHERGLLIVRAGKQDA